ncbi:MAG: hypothetical protein AB8H03_08205 [Saprospiraceae bacterium]
MRNLFLLLVCIFFSQNVFTQTQDSTSQKRRFELSFGSNILFIPQSKLIDYREEEALIIPTSSVLLFGELRPDHRMRIPLFFNLPIETKQFLVNNQLISERASPALGAGLQFRLFNIGIDEKSKVEFELGPLVSLLFDKKSNPKVSPLLAGRFRLQQNDHFVMFIGTSFNIGINVFGLFFGTGVLF